MSNLLGESSLKSVESGFANFKTGSDGQKDGAGTSSLKSNESGFANFENRAVCIKNHAALEPFKEQASAKSETNWVFDLIVKLKKIEEHIHKELLSEYHNKLEKLKDFIHVLEKLEHELKAEHKENEKLWKGLESEFSSVMTLCDELNENLEHLHDAATEDMSDVSASGKRIIVCLLSDKGLQKLDIENVKVDYNENKVPSRTFKGKRMSTPIEDKDINVIDIKSCDVLAQQLELARTSQNPVVMLFYAKCIKPCRGYYLPKFDDLRNQYRHLDGDIKFFRVRVKRAATDFKVKAYPTVLVLMPGSCGLQVVGRLSIEETIIIPAFVTALKTLLDKCLKGVLPV